MSVSANLARIRATIGAAPITLVAVTKNVGLADITEAFNCGVTEFGENRVQDALDKQSQMPESMSDKVHWNLNGHLQTNKVKKVIGKFALIHSVDSRYLAEEISKEAVKKGIDQKILLQVKVVDDPGKSGFSPEQLRAEFAAINQLPGITIQGLMTMAPFTDDVAVRREAFAGLKELRDELAAEHKVELAELSMGMSQDWHEAVSCGSTMIRVGRAIFAPPDEKFLKAH
jgi:pyridoxal phosphate enzyme (YggS family)